MDAGINVVGIDFTNMVQWDQRRDRHWSMLLNVKKEEVAKWRKSGK